MDIVSVIIPTFNRFNYLLNTIKSVKEQTYNNIEIIVVNDCSNEKEYYEYNWKENNINIIHLETNSKNLFGNLHESPKEHWPSWLKSIQDYLLYYSSII